MFWEQEFQNLLASVEHEAQKGEEDRVNTEAKKIEFSGKAKLVGDTIEQTFTLYVTILLHSWLIHLSMYEISGCIISWYFLESWGLWLK